MLTLQARGACGYVYDGCIRFIKQAVERINNKNMQEAHDAIIRAQDIILEFMSTLDMNYEISQNLLALYDYMHGQLIEANIQKDADILQEVLELLTELRDTWAEAVKNTRRQIYKQTYKEGIGG